MKEMIGEKDLKNITNVIFEYYHLDLNEYAFIILRKRITNALQVLNYKNTDNFIQDVINNSNLFDRFLYEINVEETEMFRDSAVWRVLKEQIIPNINSESTTKIWFPCVSSGDDIFSLAILLQELGCYNKTQIIASTPCKLCIDKIKQGIYLKNKIEVNNANYKRFFGNNQLSDYYTLFNKNMYLNLSLLENVKFIEHSIFETSLNNVNLVIFRNRMLYFNKNMKNKAIELISDKILKNGYLIIGLNESIGEFKNNFKIFDKYNNIYIKQ